MKLEKKNRNVENNMFISGFPFIKSQEIYNNICINHLYWKPNKHPKVIIS